MKIFQKLKNMHKNFCKHPTFLKIFSAQNILKIFKKNEKSKFCENMQKTFENMTKILKIFKMCRYSLRFSKNLENMPKNF